MEPSSQVHKSVNLKIVLICIFLFLAVILGLVAAIKYRHSQLGKVNISVVPSDSVISVDGNKTSSMTQYLKPGEHTVEASRSGFKNDVRKISVIRNTTTDVYLIPAPITNEAQQWLKQHPQEQKLREKYAGYNSALIQSAIEKNYPIITELPLDTAYYDIDYGTSMKYPGDPSKVAIYITALPANREMALDWLRYAGYDPTKFEIIYQVPK